MKNKLIIKLKKDAITLSLTIQLHTIQHDNEILSKNLFKPKDRINITKTKKHMQVNNCKYKHKCGEHTLYKWAS